MRLIKTSIMMAKDLGAAIELEIHAQDYPYNLDQVKQFVMDHDKCGFMASIGARVIGAAYCSSVGPALMLSRITVHPKFQQMGASCSLMSSVSARALALDCNVIRITVPSYKLDDKTDPDYIGWWFESMEFKAVKCLDRYYYRYGRYHDGYVFEALV